MYVSLFITINDHQGNPMFDLGSSAHRIALTSIYAKIAIFPFILSHDITSKNANSYIQKLASIHIVADATS